MEETFPESQGGKTVGQLQPFQSTLDICTGDPVDTVGLSASGCVST